MHKMTLKN